LETTEDILKEFEDFAAREETNPNFTLKFTQDQFGKETLFIKLFGLGGQFKSPKQKIIISIVLLVFFIPFTFVFGAFMLLFYAVAFYLLFVDTFFEINKEIIAKKSVVFGRYIISKKEINCNELDRFEVVRQEYRTKKGTKVNFELIASFKNENKLEIYGSHNPALVNALDDVIEKFIGIQDKSNKGQLSSLKKTKSQVAFEKKLKEPNFTSKPSKSYPFKVKSNLIQDEIIYLSKYNHQSFGVFLVFFGFFWCSFGILFLIGAEGFPMWSAFIFSPIGVPFFLWGLSKLLNKQHVNVTQQKIVYFTKPISLKKQKELLKSRVAKVEVVRSGMTTNGVMSYHLIAVSKDNSKHKLIRHAFNRPALEHICQKINERLGLTS